MAKRPILLAAAILASCFGPALAAGSGSAAPPQQLPQFEYNPNLTKPRRPFADREKLVALANECATIGATTPQPIQRRDAVHSCGEREQDFLDDNRRVEWTGTVVNVAALRPRGAAVEIQIAPTVFLGGLSEGGMVFPMGVIDEPSPLFDKVSNLAGGETVKFKATLWSVFTLDVDYPEHSYIGAQIEDIEVLPAAQ